MMTIDKKVVESLRSNYGDAFYLAEVETCEKVVFVSAIGEAERVILCHACLSETIKPVIGISRLISGKFLSGECSGSA